MGKMMKQIGAIALTAMISLSAAGCGSAATGLEDAGAVVAPVTTEAVGFSDTDTLFTKRDLTQTADLSAATTLVLERGKDVRLTAEGVYVIQGTAVDATLVVDAPEDAKVQLVLDGVSITNTDAPAIYVMAGDKVFVTTTGSRNSLAVTGAFAADGETQLDAVIFSRSDITLNGTGSLSVKSETGNGISSKDDLKITGGTYEIETALDSLEANDAILLYDGDITIETGKDALHCENSEDEALGSILMQNGTLKIRAADDGLRANNLIQIEGGSLTIDACTEGIEATRILINGGTIDIEAQDDGLNASRKINEFPSITVNGGTISVNMASGDTDAFDSNGSITVNGGDITVTGMSAFDADGIATLNGGQVMVNGQTITQFTQTGPGGGPGGGVLGEGGPGGGVPGGFGNPAGGGRMQKQR
jgi:hypothetical protein